MLTLDTAGHTGITITDQERAHALPAIARLLWWRGEDLDRCELPEIGGEQGIDEMLRVVAHIKRIAKVLDAIRGGSIARRDPALEVLDEAIGYASGPVSDHENALARGEDSWSDATYREDKRVVALLRTLRDRVAALPATETVVTLSAQEALSLSLGLQYDSLGDHLAGCITESGPGSILSHEGLTPATEVEWRHLVEDFGRALVIGRQLFAAVREQRGVELRADRVALVELLSRLEADYAYFLRDDEETPALVDGLEAFAAIRRRVVA